MILRASSSTSNCTTRSRFTGIHGGQASDKLFDGQKEQSGQQQVDGDVHGNRVDRSLYAQPDWWMIAQTWSRSTDVLCLVHFGALLCYIWLILTRYPVTDSGGTVDGRTWSLPPRPPSTSLSCCMVGGRPEGAGEESGEVGEGKGDWGKRERRGRDWGKEGEEEG
jgi:hypothetical protein